MTSDNDRQQPKYVKISKYLSKHLRHQPERLGLELAPGGWVIVDKLLAAEKASFWRSMGCQWQMMVMTFIVRKTKYG